MELLAPILYSLCVVRLLYGPAWFAAVLVVLAGLVAWQVMVRLRLEDRALRAWKLNPKEPTDV